MRPFDSRTVRDEASQFFDGRTRGARQNTRSFATANSASYPFGARSARIYRPSSSVMQARRADKSRWVLEFEDGGRHWVEPLMGWSATDDAFTQIRLEFATLSEAVAYAEREALNYRVYEPAREGRRRKSYLAALLDRYRFEQQRSLNA